MLGFLFGFNARIGRLHYFLSSVGLAIFMTLVIFAITSSAIHSSGGLHGSATDIVLSQFRWPLIATGAFFVLISLTLQSMRFRDIGWDPVCIIPGWIALVVIDKLIATKFPALSLGHEHHGTIVGAAVNLGLFMALVFWPSSSDEGSAPTLGAPHIPDAPSRLQSSASLTSSRIARIAGTEFGRRAF